MQNLRLERPLVCFDLETTGTVVMLDRIVQIAMIRVEPDGGRRSFDTLVNPETAIPPGATAVHGIDDAMVADAPTFAAIRPEMEAMLEGADLLGYNMIRFDLPLLKAEIERAGGRLDLAGRRLLDAMAVFHRMEPRNLEAAVRFYCGRELAGAHSALADAEATLDVLDAQLARYADLPRDAEALHAFCNQRRDGRGGGPGGENGPRDERFLDGKHKLYWDETGEAALAFGKHKGKTLRRMAADARDRTYLEWMLTSDFSPEVKDILTRALAGDFPARR